MIEINLQCCHHAFYSRVTTLCAAVVLVSSELALGGHHDFERQRLTTMLDHQSETAIYVREPNVETALAVVREKPSGQCRLIFVHKSHGIHQVEIQSALRTKVEAMRTAKPGHVFDRLITGSDHDWLQKMLGRLQQVTNEGTFDRLAIFGQNLDEPEAAFAWANEEGFLSRANTPRPIPTKLYVDPLSPDSIRCLCSAAPSSSKLVLGHRGSVAVNGTAIEFQLSPQHDTFVSRLAGCTGAANGWKRLDLQTMKRRLSSFQRLTGIWNDAEILREVAHPKSTAAIDPLILMIR